MSSTHKPILIVALAVISLLVLLYSLVIYQDVLLGIAVVVAIWTVYVLYTLVGILGRIADALERLAGERGAERAVEYEN
ncbi:MULTISPECIES: glycerol ABC transporter substrate-binding protein [Haloarcula]|uniref:glycerol ABC transporter substrate-binding protein n=1 Tax=Haloarcula TaxID=2237 RepID=UPI0023E852A2|nr:glycerol ABC transporter substrate-binding protein [Halomicroarcula sp. SHR3]